MGCNTSKESVPQNEGQENEITDDKTGNNENKEEANHVTESAASEKSASAKTITIRTNPCSANKPEVNTLGKAEPDQDQAAVKIQAAFRGHQTRKSMKQAVKPNSAAPAPSEPTQKELEAEFRADDTELCHAATKIQASFRGHMTRKQIGKEEGGTTPSRENQGNEEELDIDLSDPDLNKAAVKIQASFRGHMVRKENEDGQ